MQFIKISYWQGNELLLAPPNLHKMEGSVDEEASWLQPVPTWMAKLYKGKIEFKPN